MFGKYAENQAEWGKLYDLEVLLNDEIIIDI